MAKWIDWTGTIDEVMNLWFTPGDIVEIRTRNGYYEMTTEPLSYCWNWISWSPSPNDIVQYRFAKKG